MIVNVTLVGDTQLLSRIRSMPRAVNQALYVKAMVLALKLEKLVKTGKLNGQVLNHITGALARSINHQVVRMPMAVMAKVFSSGDVKYAAIHEYGGTTSPHVILPKRASVLSFMAGGSQVFASKVNHPGSKMPQRSFLRSSLTDMSREISLGLKEAAVKAVQQGIHG